MVDRSLSLITGGSGYFGTLLRNSLHEKGKEVKIFDLFDADDRPKGVSFIQGDIQNYDEILKACKGVKTVFHCVAQVPLAKDKSKFYGVNVNGTENLLKASLEAGVQKIVLLSSSAIFGIPEQNPVNEKTLPNPVEDYGKAKLEGERLAEQYAKEFGLDVTIIRPRTILGHGRLGIFQLLFDWISKGSNVYVFDKGKNTYQFIHADDLADACIKAAERPGFSVYNIGAEKYCSMYESLEGLIKYANSGSKVKSLPMKPAVLLMKYLSKLNLAPFAPYHWLMYGHSLYFDISKAKKELNWQPKWGNVDMLCNSYDWYLKHKNELKSKKEGSLHSKPVKEGILAILRWIS